MASLADLNDADPDVLRPRLLALTAAPDWAEALLLGRPYDDLDALFATSDEAVAGLDEPHVDDALAGHPRIGERAAGLNEESATRSAQEQSGMARAGSGVQDEMARGNAAYEERFGRIYLVAAAGRSAEELLALLRQRLGNDPDTELDVVRGELARISRLRLADTWQDRQLEGHDEGSQS